MDRPSFDIRCFSIHDDGLCCLSTMKHIGLFPIGSLIVWWKAITLARIYGLPNGFLKLLRNVRTDSKFLTCSKLNLDSVKAGNIV